MNSGQPVRAPEGGHRLQLDLIVARLGDPDFVCRHRRAPVLRERGGHVSPAVLAVSSSRSKYVRRWRRHARTCPDCATAFRFLGLSLQ